MVGLLAEDEERDLVVGLDGHEVVNVRGDKFEDKHDIVSLIQVHLLVFLDG